MKPEMWNFFRRMLLGTVVESLLQEGFEVDFPTLALEFHDESEFRVPRLDNFMRFKGAVTATLLSAPRPGQLAGLDVRLRRIWPEIVDVLEIPIGDRLTGDRNHVQIRTAPEAGDRTRVEITFDLVAD